MSLARRRLLMANQEKHYTPEFIYANDGQTASFFSNTVTIDSKYKYICISALSGGAAVIDTSSDWSGMAGSGNPSSYRYTYTASTRKLTGPGYGYDTWNASLVVTGAK